MTEEIKPLSALDFGPDGSKIDQRRQGDGDPFLGLAEYVGDVSSGRLMPQRGEAVRFQDGLETGSEFLATQVDGHEKTMRLIENGKLKKAARSIQIFEQMRMLREMKEKSSNPNIFAWKIVDLHGHNSRYGMGVMDIARAKFAEMMRDKFNVKKAFGSGYKGECFLTDGPLNYPRYFVETVELPNGKKVDLRIATSDTPVGDIDINVQSVQNLSATAEVNSKLQPWLDRGREYGVDVAEIPDIPGAYRNTLSTLVQNLGLVIDLSSASKEEISETGTIVDNKGNAYNALKTRKKNGMYYRTIDPVVFQLLKKCRYSELFDMSDPIIRGIKILYDLSDMYSIIPEVVREDEYQKAYKKLNKGKLSPDKLRELVNKDPRDNDGLFESKLSFIDKLASPGKSWFMMHGDIVGMTVLNDDVIAYMFQCMKIDPTPYQVGMAVHEEVTNKIISELNKFKTIDPRIITTVMGDEWFIGMELEMLDEGEGSAIDTAFYYERQIDNGLQSRGIRSRIVTSKLRFDEGEDRTAKAINKMTRLANLPGLLKEMNNSISYLHALLGRLEGKIGVHDSMYQNIKNVLLLFRGFAIFDGRDMAKLEIARGPKSKAMLVRLLNKYEDYINDLLAGNISSFRALVKEGKMNIELFEINTFLKRIIEQADIYENILDGMATKELTRFAS